MGDTKLYDILGVSPDATTQEISKAYRKLALTCHPDRGGDPELFDQICKARDILIDPGSRERYDASGRTTALSLEEEFRESFFGGGSSKKNSNSEPQQRRREPAPNERQQMKMGMEEPASRMQGQVPPRNGHAAAAPGQSTSAARAASDFNVSPAGENLAVGSRVTIVGITARPDLNGKTGTLVAWVQDRWQVRLDEDLSEKLLKAKNLMSFGPPAQGSAASAAPAPGGYPSAPSKAAGPKAAPRSPPPNVDVSNIDLPSQRYRVVVENAFVRQDPTADAPLLGRKMQGTMLTSLEETFDGWIRLANEPGWILKDMQGKRGITAVLMPVGIMQELPVPKPLPEPQLLRFTVMHKPLVAVRSLPSKDAPIIGSKRYGVDVIAVTQTYCGWLRLAEEEHAGGGAWMLTYDEAFGQLLQQGLPHEAMTPAKQPAAAASKAAASKASTAPPPRGQAGVSSGRSAAEQAAAAATAAAEARLQEAKRAEGERREAERKGLETRINKAKGNVADLQAIIEGEEGSGFRAELQHAKTLLQEALREKEQREEQNVGLLKRLELAAASGDTAAVKAARQAAKDAGLDKKEIARAFALGSAQADVASNVPAPPASSKRTPAAAAVPKPAAPTPPPNASVEEDTSKSCPKPPDNSTILDGRWLQEDSGQYIATITGSSLSWADGLVLPLERPSERKVECELHGDRFKAELDDKGKLIWTDGNVWVREQA